MGKCKFKPIKIGPKSSEEEVLGKIIERANDFQESTPGCKIVSVSHTVSTHGNYHYKGTALIAYHEIETAKKDDEDAD
ncbi:MAG: hypothetical protein KBC42_03800 [Candidatus Pacebacteria bacterium]|nr:hypothetical protein [Candidatus Paceibacterota bacterium]MBP9781016.1 hypothetical protein [Candidatus Paceibacterota bacterium]